RLVSRAPGRSGHAPLGGAVPSSTCLSKRGAEFGAEHQGAIWGTPAAPAPDSVPRRRRGTALSLRAQRIPDTELRRLRLSQHGSWWVTAPAAAFYDVARSEHARMRTSWFAHRETLASAAEIRIRAERRVGELERAQKETVGLNRGGRPTSKTGSPTNPVS